MKIKFGHFLFGFEIFTILCYKRRTIASLLYYTKNGGPGDGATIAFA